MPLGFGLSSYHQPSPAAQQFTWNILACIADAPAHRAHCVGFSSCLQPFSVAVQFTWNHLACTADVPEDGSAPSNLEVEHLPVVSLQPGGEDNYVIGESVVCHSLILGQEFTQLCCLTVLSQDFVRIDRPHPVMNYL